MGYTWIPSLASGIIELFTIILVLITDSDIFRAIGSLQQVLINIASMILIGLAENDFTSTAFIPTFALHGIAFGQALGTFILNGDGEVRTWFNFLNCASDGALFEGNCW